MAKSSLSDMISQLSLNNAEEDNLNFYLTTLRRKGRLQYFFSSTALFIPEMSKRNGPIRMKRAAQRSPPPPPSKRMRASPPSVRAPQASSTLREEYDLASDRPPIVLRLSKDRLAASKPPKKTPRLSMNSTIGSVCDYCHEKVTRMDIKSKNVLVKCSDHYVHKYCMKDCLEKH